MNKTKKGSSLKTIKVAVIGCGYWGPNLIRNFSQIDSTELCYICDLDARKLQLLKKAYPAAKITQNYIEVLKDPKVDAVAIATPVFSHYPIAKDALMHNKHVLIEKPMTASVKEAEKLIELAKKKNRFLMVDHTFEYAEPVMSMKEIVKQGEIGRIYYMRADWLNLGLLQPDVNVIWDLGIHAVSIINYISGMKPISLRASAGAYIRKDIPEVAHLHIKYKDNVAAYLTVSWLEPKKTRSITIAGSKKLVVYNLLNEEEQTKIFNKGVDLTKSINDTRQFKINYRYGDIYSPYLKNIEPLRTMCTHFADCIIYKRKPKSDGESGLCVVKILEAAEKSLKNNGKEVDFKND